MLSFSLLDFAEQKRTAALDQLNGDTQIELGQYFTPIPAAVLIASFVQLPENGSIRVLDPGAGSGVLTAALVHRVLTERSDLSVEIVAIERDAVVLQSLKSTLQACEQAGRGRVRANAVEADFILDSIGLDASLDLDSQFDVVLENPPYGKLAATSTHRLAMRSAGIDVPNLYAAFLSLSVAALREGGQLVAITPRSFFNGPYFGEFRAHLLASIALEQVHVFDSRSTVFADTGVLQENVIFAGTRGKSPGVVELSVSRDHTGDISTRTVAYPEVVFPNDPNRFIRILTDPQDRVVADIILSQPCSLHDLGVQVSTGRVVDFRSRHAISYSCKEGAVPLIYAGNLCEGRVEWPKEIRKPQWFHPSDDKDFRKLLPEGWYVVVKRFSSKEERRRVVASVWSPRDIPGRVAFENHLNVFHIGHQGMDEQLAKGITVWLNSSIIETFFRTFSGHTQVNATDLRTLRFPTAETLRELGSNMVISQTEVDSLIQEVIPA